MFTSLSIVVICRNQIKEVIRMINSITSLNRPNTEIIVVDDCSIDNTYEILSKYDIKLFRTETYGNKSVARNIGLKNATGEYVLFADGDDYYMEGLNEIKNLKHDAYLVKFYEEKTDLILNDNLENVDVLNYHSSTDIYEICLWSTCSHIIRREFLIENNLYWNENFPILLDDFPFNVALLDACDPVFLNTKDPIYYYKHYESSTSNVNTHRIDDLSTTDTSLLLINPKKQWLVDVVKHRRNKIRKRLISLLVSREDL